MIGSLGMRPREMIGHRTQLRAADVPSRHWRIRAVSQFQCKMGADVCTRGQGRGRNTRSVQMCSLAGAPACGLRGPLAAPSYGEPSGRMGPRADEISFSAHSRTAQGTRSRQATEVWEQRARVRVTAGPALQCKPYPKAPVRPGINQATPSFSCFPRLVPPFLPLLQVSLSTNCLPEPPARALPPRPTRLQMCSKAGCPHEG